MISAFATDSSASAGVVSNTSLPTTLSVHRSHSMLTFDGNAFAQALRTLQIGARFELFRSRYPELLQASWEDLKHTDITESIMEQVVEFDCSKEV